MAYFLFLIIIRIVCQHNSVLIFPYQFSLFQSKSELGSNLRFFNFNEVGNFLLLCKSRRWLSICMLLGCWLRSLCLWLGCWLRSVSNLLGCFLRNLCLRLGCWLRSISNLLGLLNWIFWNVFITRIINFFESYLINSLNNLLLLLRGL